MGEVALIQDLQVGTVFRKPKGDVLFMLTTNAVFDDIAHHKGTWFPQPGGRFNTRPSIYPVPVDRKSLHFAHMAWVRARLARYTIPAVSLHLGRFEFFPLDKEVVVEAVSEGPAIDLDEYVIRDGPVERTTRIWNAPSNGTPYIVVKYPARYWTKSAAWDHLVANPPPEVLRWPGISSDSNPYRAKHWPQREFCWMAKIPSSKFIRQVDVEVVSEVSYSRQDVAVALLWSAPAT